MITDNYFLSEKFKKDQEMSHKLCDGINWEQRRYEIAKEMLHAIYIDDGNAERDDDSDLNFEFKSIQGSAREAVRFADALIEELKKAK